MNKYNIPAENVVMHRDASGKTCSRMMIEDRPSLWPYFKDRISGGDGSLEDDGLKPKMKGKVTNASVLNVRESPSTSGRIVHKLNRNQVVGIYEELNGWYKIDYIDGVKKKYGYVSKDYISIINENPEDEETNGDIEIEKPSVSVNKKGIVKVNSALNMRSGPGSNYGVIGTLRNNDKVEIIKEVDGWYEIRFNGKVGYASKSYITIVNEGSNNGTDSVIKEGTVYGVSTNLNVRTGPGTSYQVIGYLLSGDKVKILGEENGWYKVQFNASTGTKNGYVSKDYIKV